MIAGDIIRLVGLRESCARTQYRATRSRSAAVLQLNERGKAMIGTIKLFNEQNCDGCVMADDGGVMFFHRAYVEPGYQRR
jgi:hypothetical protein